MIRFDKPRGDGIIASMLSTVLTVDEIRREAVGAFASFHPQRIILFGSYGSGTPDAESDVDLIVVYETEKRFLDRLGELYTAWRVRRPVDILAYTPLEFAELLATRPFIRDIVDSGMVLYERS